MLILENHCPKCEGNLIVGEDEMFLTCENCGYNEVTKDKIAFNLVVQEAVEWGPKEKRLEPSEIGKLILNPFGGLFTFLKETLGEAMRGLDMEEHEMKALRRYKLIKEE